MTTSSLDHRGTGGSGLTSTLPTEPSQPLSPSELLGGHPGGTVTNTESPVTQNKHLPSSLPDSWAAAVKLWVFGL